MGRLQLLLLLEPELVVVAAAARGVEREDGARLRM